MPARLPGMPLSADDIHVCTGIGDGQQPAAAPPPAPRPRPPAPYLEWIVLTHCPACNRSTGRYCNRHDVLWAKPEWRTRGG